ncbi:MAG TPA: phosphoglucosamine mutase, partial [Acidimicrobiales bacterium]|nr:phosphoglucosamine mutase [Acidimicrobiales bacterium]
MSLRFGTDGVRGVANTELSPELVLALGRAAARVLGGPAFAVGRDTRRSGPLLCSALAAGVAAEGVDVVDLGVVPTPTVAFASEEMGVAAAVVSASHNPFADNGVKLFAPGGRKLSADVERRLEAEAAAVLDGTRTRERAGPTGADVGAIGADRGAVARYAEHLVSSLEGRSLRGLRVVVDCGNGAACELAPDVLRRLGASVEVIHDEPDGTNINSGCGSTDPSSLQETVRGAGADVGVAFDGDADRVLAVDHRGQLVDGDQILALCALDLSQRGRLRGDTVVVTVMANLGLWQAMAAQGITVHQTPVGDRYVLEALEAGGWSLGGEQSGHLVFRDLATTGDGILTGLQLLDLVQRRGRPLAELAAGAMRRVPQVLHNVRVADGDALAQSREVQEELAAV